MTLAAKFGPNPPKVPPGRVTVKSLQSSADVTQQIINQLRLGGICGLPWLQSQLVVLAYPFTCEFAPPEPGGKKPHFPLLNQEP